MQEIVTSVSVSVICFVNLKLCFLFPSLFMGSLSTLEIKVWFCFWISDLELLSLQFIRPEKPDWWRRKIKNSLFCFKGMVSACLKLEHAHHENMGSLLVFEELCCNGGVLWKCIENEVYICMWSCNNTIDLWTLIVARTQLEHLYLRNTALVFHILMVFMKLMQMVP